MPTIKEALEASRALTRKRPMTSHGHEDTKVKRFARDVKERKSANPVRSRKSYIDSQVDRMTRGQSTDSYN